MFDVSHQLNAMEMHRVWALNAMEMHREGVELSNLERIGHMEFLLQIVEALAPLPPSTTLYSNDASRFRSWSRNVTGCGFVKNIEFEKKHLDEDVEDSLPIDIPGWRAKWRDCACNHVWIWRSQASKLSDARYWNNELNNQNPFLPSAFKFEEGVGVLCFKLGIVLIDIGNWTLYRSLGFTFLSGSVCWYSLSYRPSAVQVYLTIVLVA